MEQALVRFGRFVNDVEGQNKGDKYIQLAKFLLDCRGAASGGSQYDQSYAPVTQQYEAVGHAVRAVYCYSAMADVAMETHDPDYTSAIQSIWNNLINKKYYVTGGVGSGETSEGFGKDYSLPNNAYCESCSGCGELFFQYKMNLAYHDAKYADLYEDTLYNAILGDVDLDAKNFTYTNPLDSDRATLPLAQLPLLRRKLPPHSPHAAHLDVRQIPRRPLRQPLRRQHRQHQKHRRHRCGDDPNHRLPVERQRRPHRQSRRREKPSHSKSACPDRDVSTLYATSPQRRRPQRLTVNGEPITPDVDNGYAVISRTWKAGDKVTFILPLKPQRITASDKISADAHRVALRYGPLLYNIESADQNVDLPLADNSPLTDRMVAPPSSAA